MTINHLPARTGVQPSSVHSVAVAARQWVAFCILHFAFCILRVRPPASECGLASESSGTRGRRTGVDNCQTEAPFVRPSHSMMPSILGPVRQLLASSLLHLAYLSIKAWRSICCHVATRAHGTTQYNPAACGQPVARCDGPWSVTSLPYMAPQNCELSDVKASRPGSRCTCVRRVRSMMV
jgi:hypothetical protein